MNKNKEQANAEQSVTFSHELEKMYYHVLLINPRTDEFGNKLEADKRVILTPEEFQQQAQANFYGYQVKVLHDPTLKQSEA